MPTETVDSWRLLVPVALRVGYEYAIKGDYEVAVDLITEWRVWSFVKYGDSPYAAKLINELYRIEKREIPKPVKRKESGRALMLYEGCDPKMMYEALRKRSERNVEMAKDIIKNGLKNIPTVRRFGELYKPKNGNNRCAFLKARGDKKVTLKVKEW